MKIKIVEDIMLSPIQRKRSKLEKRVIDKENENVINKEDGIKRIEKLELDIKKENVENKNTYKIDLSGIIINNEMENNKKVVLRSTKKQDKKNNKDIESLSFEIGCSLNNKLFSDIKFIVGESNIVFYGHKIIIGSRSLFFREIFNRIEEDEIKFRDIKSDVFFKVLNYIYTGRYSFLYIGI
jgi:hypothetical protein